MAKQSTVRYCENGTPRERTYTFACWNCGSTEIDEATEVCRDCSASNKDEDIPAYQN